MLVVDLSLQRICYNGYVLQILREDLAGFHANGYMPNGTIGGITLSV
jgi:hypothetical protein